MNNQELIEIFEKVSKKRPYELSDNTIKTYIQNVIYMVEYLNKDILDITNKDIRRYFIEIDSEISDNTYKLKLSSITRFYDILLYYPTTEDLIKENPTNGINTIRVKDVKKKIPLSKEESKLLIKFSKNQRDKAIIITLLNTGLRIHELINLTLDGYLNREVNTKVKLEVNKGSHNDDYMRLDEETRIEIDKYLETRDSESAYLFVSNHGNKMDRTCISRTIKTIARRSGEFTEERISQLCNHLFRTTCATNMAEEEVPIEVIAKKLRHHSITTTMVYVKPSEERMKKYDKCI